MHIGFFTDGYLPQLNGVATSIELLARTLEEQGQTVSIFTPRMGKYVDQRPRVYRLPSFKATNDPPLWVSTPISMRVLRAAPGLKLDIVHSHAPFALHVLAYQVARRQHIPMVYTYHTLLPAHVATFKLFQRVGVPPRFAERYSAWTNNLCDRVIAPSEKIKDLLEQFGTHCGVTVIHNGIETRRFENIERGFLHARLGLGPEARILLAVGRLTQEKNLGFLVNALRRIAQSDPNVCLVAVGQGPLRYEYEAQAEREGFRKNLIFAGPMPPADMPKVYADADIYVSASFSEAHSMAALEALASSLPLVVVRDQSLAMMVAEGENGFVTDLDERAFAGRILQILNDPDLQGRMRRTSHELSCRFSVQTQARELIELYSNVIEEYKRKGRRGDAATR